MRRTEMRNETITVRRMAKRIRERYGGNSTWPLAKMHRPEMLIPKRKRAATG